VKARRGFFTVLVLALLAIAAALTMTPAFAQQPGQAGQAQGQPGQPGMQPGMQRGPGSRPFPRGRDPRQFPAVRNQPGAPGAQPEGTTPHGGAVPPGEGAASGHETTSTAHEETEGHGEHGAKGEHEHERKPFNFADFGNKEVTPYAALLINFALLVGMYYLMGRKGVADGLKKRRERVAKEIEEAQRMLEEAEGRAKTYQSKLKNLEGELENARKALQEAGKGERDRIVREAEEKAERMKRDAAFLVEQEVKQMREDLTKEAVALAMQAAEEVLKTKVTEADHDRLAQDFLSELDKAAGPVGARAGGAA
jgi:F-type H+-transporting ATPase subunit b